MRTLRPAVSSDTPVLADLLRVEGIPDAEMVFALWTTYVFEEAGMTLGFVTLAMVHGLPMIVHFVVARTHRNAARARFLWHGAQALARAAGFARLILHACGARERRLVEYFYRVAPYEIADGRAYYVVAA